MKSRARSASASRSHAVVIGGARGIGEAIVRRLLLDGWSVTLADKREQDARALCRELKRQNFDVYAETADITRASDLKKLAQKLRKRAGVAGIGAAVNSVGVFDERAGLIKTLPSSFERMMRINVTGAFLFSQILEPLLAKNASLVHIGSVNGKIAGPNLSAYKVSKAALHMMAKCLALELAKDPRRIRVNVVGPGWVDTPGERSVMRAEGQAHVLDDPQSARGIPLGRRTEASEVADAAAFLCSARGSAITGQILCVDCGISASYPG